MIRSLLFFFFFLPINLEKKIKEASSVTNIFDKIENYKKLLPEYTEYHDSTAYIHYKIALRFEDLAGQNPIYYDSAVIYFNKSLQYFQQDDGYSKASLNSIHLSNCYRNNGSLSKSFSVLSNYHYAIQSGDYHDYLISFSEGLKANNNDQLNLSLLKFIRKIISQPENFDLDYYIENSINLSNLDTINKNPVAITYLEEALKKVVADPNQVMNKLKLYNELGIRHAEYKNFNEAEKYYLLLNDPMNANLDFKMKMYNNLSDLYTKKHEFEKAIHHNLLAYELLESNPYAFPSHKAKNLLGLSKIYYFQGNLHLALEQVDCALAKYPIGENTIANNEIQEMVDQMVYRNALISKIYQDSFNLGELKKIDSLMDVVRTHQADAITKVEYRKLSIDFYKKAALDCINYHVLNEALYFKEKAKGILLAEDYLQLTNEKDIIKFKFFVDSITNVTNIPMSTIEKGFCLIKPVVDVMAEKYHLVKNINNQFFKHSIDQLLSANTVDHVYLDFFFTNDELLIFKITDKVNVIRQKLHPDIEKMTREYIDAIINEKDICLGPIIYDAFIRPLGPLPPKLTIIADSYLSFLPFEALYSGDNITEGYYKSYDFMINKYNIKYNYSLSMQTLMQDKKCESEGQYVFVPTFSSKNNAVAYGIERQSLLPLEYAEKEAEAINKFYSTTMFKGAEANKYNFLNILSQAKFIHFTGHAIINPSDHHLSFLAFGSDDTEDQKLYLKDLSGLSTNAEMIVLSACETATGKYAAGEGLLSLGRAMVACGSKSVLTSLWPVNDSSGESIMTKFYQQLKSGVSKSEALFKAKKEYLSMKSRNASNHPHYWSTFIFIGDDRPLPSTSWPLWVKCLAGLFFLPVVWFGYHRWSKHA